MRYGVRKDGMSTGSLIEKAVSTRGTAEFIAPIDDDPNHILVSTYLWDANGKRGVFATASRMDLRTGILRKLTTAPIRNASFLADHQGRRSEERSVGKECVRKCRSRWGEEH